MIDYGSIIIDKMNVNPGDIILVYFDLDTYDISEISDVHTMIKNIFPFNDVLAIPSKLSLNVDSKERTIRTLKDYLEDIE